MRKDEYTDLQILIENWKDRWHTYYDAKLNHLDNDEFNEAADCSGVCYGTDCAIQELTRLLKEFKIDE